MTAWESIYALAAIDGPGEGYRLYSADDAVFESRETDGMETRIYGSDNGWSAKLRVPVESMEDGWQEARELAATVEEEYGVDLLGSQRDFYEDVRDSDRFAATHEDLALRFNDEHRADISSTEATEKAATYGLYSEYAVKTGIPSGALLGGIGAGVGFMLAGPPGAAAGAGIAGLGGGTAGTAMKLDETTHQERRRQRDTKRKWAERFDSLRRWNYLRKGVEEESLLADLNRRNALRDILEERETFDTEGNRELDALEDEDLDGAMDALADLNFRSFEQLQGVTLEYTADSYADAASFVDTVTEDGRSMERPSIYSDREVFADILEPLLYEEEYPDGRRERRLASPGHNLVTAALERDEVADGIDTYLRETVPDIVEQHGDAEVLQGDWEGDA